MLVTLTYTFDLEKPEDRDRYDAITQDKYTNLAVAMREFKEQVLRKYRKYGGLEEQLRHSPPIAGEVVQFIETEFYRILEECSATLD